MKRIAQLVFIALSMPASVFADVAPDRLVAAAIERTKNPIVYDSRYYRIPYPGGDVSEGIGVCMDVVIRSYRALGIDLQLLVHKNMAAHFSAYPSKKI